MERKSSWKNGGVVKQIKVKWFFPLPVLSELFALSGILLKNGFPVSRNLHQQCHTIFTLPHIICKYYSHIKWNQPWTFFSSERIFTFFIVLDKSSLAGLALLAAFATSELQINPVVSFVCGQDANMYFLLFLENLCLLPPFRSYPLLRPNNGCTKNFISRPIIHRGAQKKKTIIIPR